MSGAIHFPELRGYRIEHLLPLIALLGLAAAVVLPYSLWAGLIGFGIAVGLLLPMLWKELCNARIRRRWVRTFAHKFHPSDIRKLKLSHPGRYRFHVRNYQGFGMNAIKPAIVIEDTTTGAFFPVEPSIANVYVFAEQNGIAIVHH